MTLTISAWLADLTAADAAAELRALGFDARPNGRAEQVAVTLSSAVEARQLMAAVYRHGHGSGIYIAGESAAAQDASMEIRRAIRGVPAERPRPWVAN